MEREDEVPVIEKMLNVYRTMVAALRDANKKRNEKVEPIYKQMETIETHLLAHLQHDKNMDGLVAFYNDGRDELDQLDEQFKKMKANVMLRQEKIENAIFSILKETNSQSIKTEHGTAFTSTQASCKIADWGVFLREVVVNALASMGGPVSDDFLDKLMEQESWSLIKRAASKDAVKAYIETENKVVPGVDFETRLQVSVRRK
jgi:flagellar basal body-associated protein FliL